MGQFTSKQWKIQQKAYVTRRELRNPFLYEKTRRRKACELAKNKNKNKNTKNKKKKNKTEVQAIIPIVQDIWTDRCIDRNTPVVGGIIVAEYHSLSKINCTR
jgi:hypothetical protein